MHALISILVLIISISKINPCTGGVKEGLVHLSWWIVKFNERPWAIFYPWQTYVFVNKGRQCERATTTPMLKIDPLSGFLCWQIIMVLRQYNSHTTGLFELNRWTILEWSLLVNIFKRFLTALHCCCGPRDDKFNMNILIHFVIKLMA